MTPQDHINDILYYLDIDARQKYNAGQTEHGGKLWNKPIMDYLGEEIIDLVIYWYTFKEQWKILKRMVLKLEDDMIARPETPPVLVRQMEEIANLVVCGNTAGTWEEELDASHSPDSW